MTWRRAGTLLLVALVAGGAAVWRWRDSVLLPLPGMLDRWRDPIEPTRAVTWKPGPATSAAPPGARPPNIVVIVADDLGYNDLTFAGGGVAGGAVPTPHIDGIARDGVTFTRGYAGNATCAPSRAAIMTGRYPTRFGFEFTPAPKQFMRLVAWLGRNDPVPPTYFADREAEVPPIDQQGLPADQITIAELLRARGYHTVGLGKWHLGEAPAMRPTARGFDEFLGFWPGAAMYLPKDDPRSVNAIQPFDPIDPFLWANLSFGIRKDDGPRFQPAGYLTDYLADEAARAITANRNRPFFMYLAFNAPHTPLQALRSDYDALPQIAHHPLRVYAAMIRALDRGVGRVLDALRANGLDEHTLVVFTSDNGGAHYIGLPDINRPYRGWKMTFFEGGVHTPFFARWPARLPRGARVDTPAAHVDIFATAAAAAGAAAPSDRAMDGVDLVRLARGEPARRPHDALFWRSGGYRSVLADGWKLQVQDRPPRLWLFDMTNDPTERRNLATARADKVAELSAVLAAEEREMVAPSWPSLIEAPVPVDQPLGLPPAPDGEWVTWAN